MSGCRIRSPAFGGDLSILSTCRFVAPRVEFASRIHFFPDSIFLLLTDYFRVQISELQTIVTNTNFLPSNF